MPCAVTSVSMYTRSTYHLRYPRLSGEDLQLLCLREGMETVCPGLPVFPGLLRPSSGRGHLPTPKAQQGFSPFPFFDSRSSRANSKSSSRSGGRSRARGPKSKAGTSSRRQRSRRTAAPAAALQMGTCRGGGSRGSRTSQNCNSHF